MFPLKTSLLYTNYSIILAPKNSNTRSLGYQDDLASSCLFSCFRGCQQLPKLATWISSLIVRMRIRKQSIAKSFDLCYLYLSKKLFFSIPTVHRSFRSPPFDINDHTSLLTDLLLLDLPLAFLPIHFTQTQLQYKSDYVNLLLKAFLLWSASGVSSE